MTAPSPLGAAALATFAEAGIRLPSERPGKRRLPCPRCRKGKADDALQLTVTPRRWAFWRCWRCGWEDKAPLDDCPIRYQPPARPEPAAPKCTKRGFHAAARRRWETRRGITPDCPVGRYLAGRGCALPPNDVGWHPTVRHPCGHLGPAMLALITDVLTGEPIGLHQTWIRSDGSGKADIPKPRLIMGGTRKHGGCVRLWPDEDVTLGLCVAEGVETALTAARGFGLAWACLDAGNLAGLPVLPGVEALTIVADHDEAGTRAADACGRRWAEAGCEVRIWKAPAEGADLNDFIQEAAA